MRDGIHATSGAVTTVALSDDRITHFQLERCPAPHSSVTGECLEGCLISKYPGVFKRTYADSTGMSVTKYMVKWMEQYGEARLSNRTR